MRVGAQLSQQKAGTPAQFPRRGRVHGWGNLGHGPNDTAHLELFLLYTVLPTAYLEGGAK
jgi:hypothetical protein